MTRRVERLMCGGTRPSGGGTHRGEDEYSVEQVHQVPGHAGRQFRPLAPKEVIAQWPTTRTAIKSCIVTGDQRVHM